MTRITAKFMIGAWLSVLAWLVPLRGDAESVWYKGWGDRLDYNRDAAYLYTTVRIDIGVDPAAAGHEVGVVYTDDGWNTVRWGAALWTGNIENSFGGAEEAWTAYLAGVPGCAQPGCMARPLTFEFALFVKTASGQMIWNSRGGHFFRITLGE